ncbi:DUF6114 domain-containing protein [uncultured Streptomyces sp.]|uniref:DUF6114 domain-containing protein n=1 Tax=uncultured Streptomyces sp. TaxID=174707 RepID=UPI002631BC04|nr:DUF6114 domain-containing protein [uncultured Streptomyces sp.]
MSPESTGQNEHYLTVFRRGFRTWRGNRPFWAGLFTMVGGVPIAYFPYANMHLGNVTLAMSTTAGAGSLIIGVLLITLGLTMWFHHIVRVFAGVAAILLALISIPVANIGGFVVGFLFSLLGGALSVSWAPGDPKAESAPAAEPAATEPAAYGSQFRGDDFPADEFHGSAVPRQTASYEPSAPFGAAAEKTEGGGHRAG